MAIPNSKKPTLGLAKAMEDTPDVSHVKEKPHPHVEPEDNFVSIGSIASKGRDALMEQLRAHAAARQQKEEKPAVIPPLSERTLREMEGGRLAVARHEERAKLHRTPKPDAGDGYMAPVYRPVDHVPNFDSKDPGARTIK